MQGVVLQADQDSPRVSRVKSMTCAQLIDVLAAAHPDEPVYTYECGQGASMTTVINYAGPDEYGNIVIGLDREELGENYDRHPAEA